uniref:WH2 domain-containing protein n=1 Tax=Panagrellus redivivus TaxID=6233 RepID=A0A7E4W4L8_PANRE
MYAGSNTYGGGPSIRRIPSLNSAFEPYQQKAPPVPPKTDQVTRKLRSAISSPAPTPPPRPSLQAPPTPKPRTIFLQPHQYSTQVASVKSSASSLTLSTIGDITDALASLPLPVRNNYAGRLTNAGFNRRQTTNVNQTPVRQGNPNVGRVVRSTSLSYHALNPEPNAIRNSRTSFENSPPPDSGLHSASETITPPLKEVDPDFRARIQQWNAVSEAVLGFGATSSAPKNLPQERDRSPVLLENPIAGRALPNRVAQPNRNDNVRKQELPSRKQELPSRKQELPIRKQELSRRNDNVRKQELPPDTSDFQRRLRILIWVNTHFDDDGTPKVY